MSVAEVKSYPSEFFINHQKDVAQRGRSLGVVPINGSPHLITWSNSGQGCLPELEISQKDYTLGSIDVNEFCAGVNIGLGSYAYLRNVLGLMCGSFFMSAEQASTFYIYVLKYRREGYGMLMTHNESEAEFIVFNDKLLDEHTWISIAKSDGSEDLFLGVESALGIYEFDQSISTICNGMIGDHEPEVIELCRKYLHRTENL
jgi:hypothetical protein